MDTDPEFLSRRDIYARYGLRRAVFTRLNVEPSYNHRVTRAFMYRTIEVEAAIKNRLKVLNPIRDY